MLDLFFDPGFLSGLAAAVGPLAFFVAPTEEIEAMIFDSQAEETGFNSYEVDAGISRPALSAGYREAA